jgi:hypothetical protein
VLVKSPGGLMLLSIPLLLMSSLVFADTCNSFATFDCTNGTPNIARLGGGSPSNQSVGFILKGTDQFSVFTANGHPASDVILVAASVGPLTGTLNGTSFTSLQSFPEKGAIHAITESLEGLGFCSDDDCKLSFGYVDLHGALGSSASLKVTENGLAPGTAIYAMLVVDGKIKYITPNSEALIVGTSTSSVPEPATLSMFVSGLIGIGGLVRRKLLA